MAEPGVLGVFIRPAQAARAVRALKEGGWADVRAALPAPFPEVVDALRQRRSRLGWVTLFGALFGTAAGFAFTIGTSLAWPLDTGGKPIVSLQPFAIVAFEVTVLIGALVNLIVLAIAISRGRRRRGMPDDSRFSEDRIGVYVAGGDAAAAEEIMRGSGAEEVRRA